MTETITINETEFDLSNTKGCTDSVEAVTEHIEKLEKQKQDMEGNLSSSIFDFKSAKKLRRAKNDMEEELDHFQSLLQKLEKQSDERLAEEAVDKAEYEIARLEKQSAALTKLCLKEIPATSRKLAVIGAALKDHQQQVQDGADMAECHGVKFPNMLDPVQRIAGLQASATLWLKNLRLPLLDEQPDVARFWPPSNLEQYPDSHQDNPKIKDDVENLLSADDIFKAAKALFSKIEKRKTVIREAESGPYFIQEYTPG